MGPLCAAGLASQVESGPRDLSPPFLSSPWVEGSESPTQGHGQQDMNKGPWEPPWPDSDPTARRTRWAPVPLLTLAAHHAPTALMFPTWYVCFLHPLYMFKKQMGIQHTFYFSHEDFPDH